MSFSIELSKIIDGMDFGGDMFGYLNKITGQIIFINDEDMQAADNNDSLDDYPAWQQEAIKETQAFLENGQDYLPLPNRHEIHEHKIMEDFCKNLPDRELSLKTLQLIGGKGAFRIFRDLGYQYGFIEDWYNYRSRSFKNIAIQWCKKNNIDFIDDVNIPDQEQVKIETKRNLYAELAKSLEELIKDEPDPIANAANTAALIYHTLPDINWAGFYFHKDGELVLGPFQGKPACVRIPLGKGVCGTAASQRKTILVSDVSKFPGHIACDAASNSEIVIPIIKQEKLLGLLDIDSPSLGRFDEEDQKGLERVVEIYVEKAFD